MTTRPPDMPPVAMPMFAFGLCFQNAAICSGSVVAFLNPPAMHGTLSRSASGNTARPRFA